MARPRQFDPDAVLDAAQRVFHAKGFEATSVQDLVGATGLSRSSLYGAFGDKQALFLAVLDRYAQAGRAATDAVCASCPPVAAVRAVLEHALEGDADAPGCLLVNAAVERAGRDAGTASRSAAARRALGARFEGLVRQAQAAREADPGLDPVATAHFLTGALYGVRALQAAGADRAALHAVVEGAVSVLRERGEG